MTLTSMEETATRLQGAVRSVEQMIAEVEELQELFARSGTLSRHLEACGGNLEAAKENITEVLETHRAVMST